MPGAGDTWRSRLIPLASPFYQVATLLIVVVLLGAVAVRLKQPLLIAFILVGIVMGPAVTGWVVARDEIELLAQLGMTILLFLVGLKLDLSMVRNLGPVALATGLGQLTFTIVFGYLITVALGYETVTALYIAVALTFSSTIIIVKLLSDKRELDSLHGRIAIGFLIVQDIAVVIAMAIIGTTTVEAPPGGLPAPVLVALAFVLGSATIAALMRWVLPAVLHVLARSHELLLIFAIGWGMLLAALGDMSGLSKEIGAFVAGFSLASTGYRETISARLTSIRDFLILFFFIDLGARLDFVAFSQTVGQAAILSAFVLVGNPLIVLAIMGFLGYRKRTGFLAGLTVAQISEFSLIFIAMGIAVGHISDEVMGLVTVVGLLTITVSTYMILYSHRLYVKVERWLAVFERKHPSKDDSSTITGDREASFDIIVFGMGRYGRQLAERLRASGLQVLGVDADPQMVRLRRQQGLNVAFGDAGDPEYPALLPLSNARWVVSSLAERDVNVVLLEAMRKYGYEGQVAVTAHSEPDAQHLRARGAAWVLRPFKDAAAVAADRIVEQVRGEREPD